MPNSQNLRLWLLLSMLATATLLITARLAWFMIWRSDELSAEAELLLRTQDEQKPHRGYIYDSNMHVLAAPGNDFEVGIDLPLVYNSLNLALDLAPLVGQTASEIIESMEDAVKEDWLYVPIDRRISPERAAAIRKLDYVAIQLSPIPRRLYPQGDLMCHTLGFVDFEGDGLTGIEAFYNRELAGQATSRDYRNVPSEPRGQLVAREGQDLVLTIDRTVQATVERHLRDALEKYQASSGSIIVMDPKTGAIMAMANYPCFDPYEFFREEYKELHNNPSMGAQYEPGSVMKLITMAAALDSGSVTAATTYNDVGVINLDGAPIRNADETVYGPIDMTQTLVWSVNTATAWTATRTGPDQFYNYLDRFGFGSPTGVDLFSEVAGVVPRPTTFGWTMGTLARNAFGQSISVTPLQMLSAVSAIANQGTQMRPYVVAEIHEGDDVRVMQPRANSNPISPDTARTLTTMAINVGANYAPLEGYTVAGKTGTAQIPVVEGDTAFYHPEDTIASFVGWVPADDPAFAAIVKLDVPKASEWGSQTAAPTFAEMAQELLILLNVPPDALRFSSAQP